VGAPIVELLQRGGLGCRVLAVTITPGQLESSNGERYAVPKRDLMAGLVVAFQKQRLRVAATIPALGSLMEELKMMRSKRLESGYVEMTGRRHDDLVLALALAWWRASRESGWGR
jgi:hypothetical protein